MSRVYLVRHATHGLVNKALAGRMPGILLSPEGEAQAARLGAWFEGRALGAILTSPLERCRQTAEAIGRSRGLAPLVVDDLNEIDCGAWTGQSFEALQDDPRWTAWNTERGRTRVPGGESIDAVALRVTGLLDRIAAQADGPAQVLVSHSDVIKAAILSLLGGSLDRHDRLAIDPASITTLDLWPGGGKVVRSNEAAA